MTANYITPIEQRHNAEVTLAQMLGAPTGDEILDNGMRYRVYQNGRLYWSKNTGVHEIHGAVLAKYLELGGHSGTRPPVNSTSTAADGTTSSSATSSGTRPTEP